jgi:nitrogen fixation protein NifU and related proteins
MLPGKTGRSGGLSFLFWSLHGGRLWLENVFGNLEKTMTDKQYDALMNEIQEKISLETQEIYGVKGLDRWRNPQFNGRLDDADAQGKITGKCGDTMEIFLCFDNNLVNKASSFTDGCFSSRLCGSFAAELAMGKNPEELFDLTGEDVLEAIGIFPKEEAHCAFLAVKTMQEAVNAYLVKQVRKKQS